MKTSKGGSYTTLLAVKIEQGSLYVGLRVPMAIGDIDAEYIEKMIPQLNERIIAEKKPGATYEKCLEQIDLHRTLLAKAYVELFETYQRTLVTATRTSSIEKAKYDMLNSIPDMKLLRQMCALTLDADKINEFVLPDEKEGLIRATIAAMA